MKLLLLTFSLLVAILTNAQQAESECINRLNIPEDLIIDGDGVEDYLSLGLDCDLHNFQFTIFNSYGETIFVTYDQAFQWEAKTEGGQMYPPDNYFWKINCTVDGEEFEQSGKFNLIY